LEKEYWFLEKEYWFFDKADAFSRTLREENSFEENVEDRYDRE
jgi:hypothetical protein